MIFLVDIGNTRAKWTTLINGKLDTISSCENNLVNHIWLDKHATQASKLIIATVAESAVLEEIKHWAEKNNKACNVVHTEEKAFGVTNGYEHYQQLGVDRWLAVLGASAIYPNQACVIVDSGSATTIDVLNEKLVHQGGWILPGLNMIVESVVNNTAQVTGELSYFDKIVFGRTTKDNVALASWAATKGMIEEAIALTASHNEQPKLLITGGNGKALCKLLKHGEYVEDLVFKGLSLYAG